MQTQWSGGKIYHLVGPELWICKFQIQAQPNGKDDTKNKTAQQKAKRWTKYNMEKLFTSDDILNWRFALYIKTIALKKN